MSVGSKKAEFIIRDNMDCANGNISGNPRRNVGGTYFCALKCAEYGPGCKGNGYD